MTSYVSMHKTYVQKTYDIEAYDQKSVRGRFASLHLYFATANVLESDYVSARTNFLISALISDYVYTNHADDWISWHVRPYYYALLSGEEGIIRRYAELGHQTSSPQLKNPIGWMASVFRGLILGDNDSLRFGSPIIDEKIRKRESVGYLRASKECLEAIMESDRHRLLKSVAKFQTARMKSQVSRMFFPAEFLSFETAFYLLLGQRCGMEINSYKDELISPFLSQAVDYSPSIPYRFLIEHCRRIGLDWRFEPLFPEIDGDAAELS